MPSYPVAPPLQGKPILEPIEGTEDDSMKAVVFHNVISDPLDEFDRQLYRKHINGFTRAIKVLRKQYEIISLPEMLSRLESGDPAPNALTITFDDGFAGVYDFARPVLAEAGATATAFILTEPPLPGHAGTVSEHRLLHFEVLEIAFRLTQRTSLDVADLGLGQLDLTSPSQTARDMNRIKSELKRLPASISGPIHHRILEDLAVSPDEIEAYAARFPKYQKLSASQIAALRHEGWTIGGHTRNHPALSSLDEATLHSELAGNLQDLSTLFGLTHPPLAYPYGAPALVGPQAPEVARQAGFSCAFTTVQEPITPSTNRFHLGRYGEDDLLHSQGRDIAAWAARQRGNPTISDTPSS